MGLGSDWRSRAYSGKIYLPPRHGLVLDPPGCLPPRLDLATHRLTRRLDRLDQPLHPLDRLPLLDRTPSEVPHQIDREPTRARVRGEARERAGERGARLGVDEVEERGQERRKREERLFRGGDVMMSISGGARAR